jgi:LacI family transcriptional regulator
VVYLYAYTTVTDSPCILPDDIGGGRLATEHVLSLGRRRIGFVNGPPSYEATRLRLVGYQQALEERGLSFDPELVWTAADWNQDSGFKLAQQAMSSATPPDALVCANDELAAGALLALWELGLRVPNDVAIVGFDDRPFAAHLPVPLTTVGLPLHEMGVEAARRLFAAVGGGPVANDRIHVPCSLVVRRSTVAA